MGGQHVAKACSPCAPGCLSSWQPTGLPRVPVHVAAYVTPQGARWGSRGRAPRGRRAGGGPLRCSSPGRRGRG